MRKIFVTILFSLILCACGSFRTAPQTYPLPYHLSWPQRFAELNSIKKWSLRAKLSIQCNNQSESISFKMEQNRDKYQLDVYGPLNLTCFRILGDSKKVTLFKSAKEQYSASSPEQLLYQQMGWSIPISNLIYWIKGIPAPNFDYKIQLDSYNHLLKLKQQDWVITIPILNLKTGSIYHRIWRCKTLSVR